MITKRVLLAWSSGKNSAFTLDVLREQGVEAASFLDTISDPFDRVAMHAVRLDLVRAQADPPGGSNPARVEPSRLEVPMDVRVVTLGALPALFAWGCGGSGRSSPPRPAATAVPTTVAAAPARTVDVCTVAPDAEVAKALGAKVRSPARSSHAVGSECDYDLDFGDRHAGLFFVWAGAPSVYFSREMATGEVESVSGLGQDAFLEHAMPEDSWDLHILVAPDLALEAKGDRKDRVLTLGRLLADKIH